METTNKETQDKQIQDTSFDEIKVAVGFFLLIPPILSVIKFIYTPIRILFYGFKEGKKYLTGYKNNNYSSSSGYDFDNPMFWDVSFRTGDMGYIYLGLLAIAGAYLIGSSFKNK